jgi:hypothetical protein
MPARFDDVIPFFGADVVAIGPLHSGEKLKEVCAWIYQPTKTLGVDVAATEMHFSDDHPHTNNAPSHFDQVEGERWLLPLHRIGEKGDFVKGQAFAVAIALVLDIDHPEKQRVVWWGQPVDLWEDESSVVAAHEDGALTCEPLQTPAELPGPPESTPA